MKSNFLVLLALFATSLFACAQPIKVPAVVTTAFHTRFPHAEAVKWGKENAKEYEAEFKENNRSISANFGLDGNWVETETVIPVADLPAAVSAAITKKYTGAIITMAEKTEMPGDKTLYEVAIKINGKKKSVELNPDGSFAK